MVYRIITCIFDGTTRCVLKVKEEVDIEGKKIYFVNISRFKVFPLNLIKQWIPAFGGISEMMKRYEEKPNYDPIRQKICKSTSRRYYFGLNDLEEIDTPKTSLEISARLNQLEAERDYYFKKHQDALSMIDNLSIEDSMKERIKESFNFHEGMKSFYPQSQDKDKTKK
jgi:hypothetical protein